MTAEPIPIVPQDDGNFIGESTTTVVIGPCACPGRPHDQDTAALLDEVPWETISALPLCPNEFAATRKLIAGLVSSWNLVDGNGDALPITEAMVRRFRQWRVEPLAGPAFAALQRSQAPLPNASGAPSRRSRRESASPNPTIRPRARHTR
jgi:hypothetical protein